MCMRVCLKILLSVLCLSFGLPAFSEPGRFVVFFTDKDNNAYTLDAPEAFLSRKSIERRLRQGLSVDESDLPVTDAYVDAFAEAGCRVLCKSKWLNAVLLESEDVDVEELAAGFPFVSSVSYVGTGTALNHRTPEYDNAFLDSPTDDVYGALAGTLEIISADYLHSKGFWGEGMTIAVLDDGFLNADLVDAGWGGNILGTKDFVNPENDDVYRMGQGHGMKVLSCMASNADYVIKGVAPEAEYWLLRSEDDKEEPAEMYYMAAAIEFADSVGCDVINASLGYTAFDMPFSSLTYDDLDGTSDVSEVAGMAVDKGMVMVASAGNEGNKSWHYITVPADAANVLAAGALLQGSYDDIASYSSRGPTSDGRVKPDVLAPGTVQVLTAAGRIVSGSGTSFASPLVAGSVACLWQAFPKTPAADVVRLLRETASDSGMPDNDGGYGTADFRKAFDVMKAGADGVSSCEIGYFMDGGMICLSGDGAEENILSVYSLSGVCLLSSDTGCADVSSLPRGVYLLHINTGKSVIVRKIII